MELSAQDTLRLKVLLANSPQAIRIDESRMTVHGLSEKGEAEIQLNPTGRDEQYIRSVKELLSGHVLGSPGGYPVYLQRWTRMGQMRGDSLEQLLLLGEPEAVVAAVSAQDLTDELARRAWWAMEDADNARHMLGKRAVVVGSMGPRLASYLLEHLPFETAPERQIETVRLVLQPGLLDDGRVADLWRRAQRKPAYYVGFLLGGPDRLPLTGRAHPAAAAVAGSLDGLLRQGDPLAALLRRVLDAPGQAYLDTVFRVLEKPSDQDVVNLVLDAVAAYFSAARPEGMADETLESLQAEAVDWSDRSASARALLAAGVGREQLCAMRVLSGLGYGVVRPLFRDSTAIGSLMRRKLQPVLSPLRQVLSALYAG